MSVDQVLERGQTECEAAIRHEEAAKFLDHLFPAADAFTFQTFDNSGDREGKKRKDLTRVFHGPLSEHVAELARLNARGAGIFVTVNETDGRGRKATNIVRVRAVFVDLDGAPLDPVMASRLPPHIVIETSPGRWHAYWLVNDLPLDRFSEIQKVLIGQFESDPAVHDLPRVMRLPGFAHRKDKPFLVKIKSMIERDAYSTVDFESLCERGIRKPPPRVEQQRSADTAPPRCQRLNSEALRNLDAWVPSLFPSVGKNADGVYRISSEVLGRDLEEDLSISPNGIKDFGVHDLDDEREGKRAPIDIVMEYHPSASEPEAAFVWLSEKLGHKGPDSGKSALEAPIRATPFAWIDPAQIPKRQWLYKPHYIRRFLSLTISTGGIGKSSLIIAESIAMATGKPLLKVEPTRPLHVWYWNGEDPMEELQRRFAAIMKHFQIGADDIGDRLYVDSGRVMPIVIASDEKIGTTIAQPTVDAMIATLRDHRIDVLMIDPFVSCHRVSENDNGAIERVAKCWSRVADEAQCSIMLAHHSRKTGGGDGVTVEDGRGASALLAAARTARTLNTMTRVEADKAEIVDHGRRAYFRAEIGKANLTAPTERADWFRIISVDLENPDQGDFWKEGDHVGVVTAWDYPKVEVPKFTIGDIKRAQAAIRLGGPWRADQRAKKEPWVGIPIAEVVGLDLSNKANRQAVAKIVGDWLEAGLLKTVDGRDHHHEAHKYVEAGKEPGVG